MTRTEAAALILSACRRHGLPLLGWVLDGKGGVVLHIPVSYAGREAACSAKRAVVRRELRRAGVPQIDIQAGWAGKEGER